MAPMTSPFLGSVSVSGKKVCDSDSLEETGISDRSSRAKVKPYFIES